MPTHSSELFVQDLEHDLEETRKEASKKFDILEIVNGDPKKPVFIPITPDVDIKSLQQQWCQNYCKAQGYALFEVSSPDDFKETGGGHDHVAG